MTVSGGFPTYDAERRLEAARAAGVVPNLQFPAIASDQGGRDLGSADMATNQAFGSVHGQGRGSRPATTNLSPCPGQLLPPQAPPASTSSPSARTPTRP